MIADLMKSDIKIVQDKQRLRPKNSEVERLLASNDKARNILGWQPKFAEKEGLRKALDETINWFTNKENLDNYKTNIYNV